MNLIAMSYELDLVLYHAALLMHVYVKFWYAFWLSSRKKFICTGPTASYVIYKKTFYVNRVVKYTTKFTGYAKAVRIRANGTRV